MSSSARYVRYVGFSQNGEDDYTHANRGFGTPVRRVIMERTYALPAFGNLRTFGRFRERDDVLSSILD
uniref:Uncharacterized protein n=1 Tax=Plectus sambesii TaxID=2011161 RepID=A0A914W7U9_9BILA